MRRVRFFVDGRGPFEGMMKFGAIGDGEIEFIADGRKVQRESRSKSAAQAP